jgi:hypothetical protein
VISRPLVGGQQEEKDREEREREDTVYMYTHETWPNGGLCGTVLVPTHRNSPSSCASSDDVRLLAIAAKRDAAKGWASRRFKCRSKHFFFYWELKHVVTIPLLLHQGSSEFSYTLVWLRLFLCASSHTLQLSWYQIQETPMQISVG